MTAKTLDEFYKEYRSGFNPITGKQNLFKDLTDEMIWNAAIKSVEENGSSHNSDYAAALYQRLVKKKFTPEQCKAIIKTVKSLNASHFA